MKYRLSLKQVITAIAIGLLIGIPMILSPFQLRTQLIYNTVMRDPVKRSICIAIITILTLITTLLVWNNSKSKK